MTSLGQVYCDLFKSFPTHVVGQGTKPGNPRACRGHVGFGTMPWRGGPGGAARGSGPPSWSRICGACRPGRALPCALRALRAPLKAGQQCDGVRGPSSCSARQGTSFGRVSTETEPGACCMLVPCSCALVSVALAASHPCGPCRRPVGRRHTVSMLVPRGRVELRRLGRRWGLRARMWLSVMHAAQRPTACNVECCVCTKCGFARATDLCVCCILHGVRGML